MRRLLVVALLLAACSSGGGGDHTTAVSRTELGDRWPLTVDHGDLECRPPGAVLFTDPDGQVYALNGTAKDHTSAADITPIWSDDGHGLKVNIGPLIDRGLELC